MQNRFFASGRHQMSDWLAVSHGRDMTRMALPAPALHTARLRLRPFDDADADGLFALHSSACVLRYWDSPPWSERARAGRVAWLLLC
jgi:RimJ/RimL family protein N-acetyltransferase